MSNDRRPRAARYARISLDKDNDEHGVTNQLADQQRTADARGYDIVMTEVDNDISASAGKHRPGYDKIMAAAERREVDVILVFQTSRLLRNRKERADAIERLKKPGVSIVATRGPSIDLSTAYGRGLMDLFGAFDTMEGEVKGERQQLANYSDAIAGKPRKAAPRPFGWQADRRTLDPAEASAIADGCMAILRGGTVTGVMRDWEARGLRPVQSRSGQWKRNSVRGILTSPRIAGISVYRRREASKDGEPARAEVGPGDWEPVVPEETLRAVQWILAQRARPGRSPTSLLGHLALCRCGNYVCGTVTRRGKPGYRCTRETRDGRPGPHVDMKREPVDEYVSAAAVLWLSRPEAAGQLIAPDGEDTAALRGEETVLQVRLQQLGALFMDGVITEADLASGRARGEQRLAEIRAGLASAGRQSVLTPLVMADSTAAEWEALSIAQRRVVIGALMTVTLYPCGAGRRFDPGMVMPPGRGIIWKH